MSTGSYYFWKWAENDLPGDPHEVYGALVKGKMHPAITPFDALPLVSTLENFRKLGRQRGEDWSWEVHPRLYAQKAHFIYLECPAWDFSYHGTDRITFIDAIFPLELGGFDENQGCMIDVLLPKVNALQFGQTRKIFYDVTCEEVGDLLCLIDVEDDNPYAILVNRRNSFVQCLAEDDSHFCVEWRENHSLSDFYDFDFWRAEYREPEKRTFMSPGTETVVDSNQKLKKTEVDDCEMATIGREDAVRIVQAFLRGEPRPPEFEWRDIKEETS